MKVLQKNKIYNIDVFKFLDKVEDNTVDLAIIDPPYNLKKDYWDKFNSEKDFFDFTFKWIDALMSKLKDNSSVYIFNTPYNSAFILQYLLKKDLTFQNWITWDKRDGMSASKRKYNNGQEVILFFTKGKKYTFNYDQIRVPYESIERIEHAFKKGILKNGKRWFPNKKGKLCGEVWHIVSERHKNKKNGKVLDLGHVSPKPLEMIERIVKASSKKKRFDLGLFYGYRNNGHR